MTTIVYGLDTGSIEDARQCVLLDLPPDVFDDADAWIEENWANLNPVPVLRRPEELEELRALVREAAPNKKGAIMNRKAIVSVTMDKEVLDCLMACHHASNQHHTEAVVQFGGEPPITVQLDGSPFERRGWRVVGADEIGADVADVAIRGAQLIYAEAREKAVAAFSESVTVDILPADLRALVREADEAADGDSNDAEINALRDALECALGLLGHQR